MAEVLQKRSPRLPKGPPQGLEPDDDVVIESGEKLEAQGESKKDGEGFVEVEKRAKVPEPPSKTIREPQVLYDYLASLKEEHWIQLSWYLYRIWPKIDRDFAEDKKYIECNVVAIDENYLLKNHGSGEYMMMLNDSSKPKNAKTIMKAYIKISDPDYPPMVNMQELDVNFPGNRTFVDNCIARGLLTVDKKPMNTTQQQGGMNSDAVIHLLGKVIDKLDNKNQNNNNQKDPTQDALTAVVTMMKEGNTASTKMLLDQMKESSPQTFVQMIAAIKELIPKAEQTKNDDSMLMKFMSIMAEKDKTIMGMMEKMMEMTVKAAAPKTVDAEGGDAFDKMIDRYLKIQELTGGGERSGGKKGTLEVIMQYGMPVADKAFGIIMNLLALKANGVQPTPQSNPMGANAPPIPHPTSLMPVTVASDPKAGTDIASAMGSGVEGEEIVGTTDTGGVVVNEAMIKQGLIQMAPMLIGALDRGQPGDQFAEGVNTMYGPKAYDLIAGIGKDKMLEYLKSNQQVWAQLAARERAVVKFIAEFLAYGSDDDAQIPPDDGTNGDEGGEPSKEGADTDGKPISTKRGVIN